MYNRIVIDTRDRPSSSRSSMFNAPRPGQRYTTNYTNGLGGSFVSENPLASSVYDDGLDPWSAQPSPAPTPIPRASPPAATFSSVIGTLCRLAAMFSYSIPHLNQAMPPYHCHTTGHFLPSIRPTRAKYPSMGYLASSPRHPYRLLALIK